jgi:curved DNA-binding protein CbpA
MIFLVKQNKKRKNFIMDIEKVKKALQIFGLDEKDIDKKDFSRVEKIYKKLCRDYHPDKNIDKGKEKFFNEKMAEINSAYDCLKEFAKFKDLDEGTGVRNDNHRSTNQSYSYGDYQKSYTYKNTFNNKSNIPRSYNYSSYSQKTYEFSFSPPPQDKDLRTILSYLLFVLLNFSINFFSKIDKFEGSLRTRIKKLILGSLIVILSLLLLIIAPYYFVMVISY